MAGVELLELEDWTCCGATAAESVGRLLSLALPARNLALAQQMNPGLDILVPCSACYLNLKKVAVKVRTDPELLTQINAVLAPEHLTLSGPVNVKHLLEVLVKDIGSERLAERVTHPLRDLTIAPYYGCQCLRPYAVFDDPEQPRSMEGVIRATGADVLKWSMGAKCCGASHMNTKIEVGLTLCGAILTAAQSADAIVTVCPMCQMNLEGYQKKLSRTAARTMPISVLYLPQLLGLAMGIAGQDLKVDLNLALRKTFQEKIRPLVVEKAAAV
jgi:heterodisulfide reductase subunit B